MNIKKTLLKGNEEHWICICGNDTMGLGFQTCNKHGNYIEPLANSDWSGLYACQECGRIIDQETREIISQNSSAYTYDKYLIDTEK